MRIVVVEDEPAIADFLVRGLEAAGYAVALANDGPGGEKLILEGEADLVILDLMLPGRSGLDVLGTIRKVRPHLPVIILSAKGEIEERSCKELVDIVQHRAQFLWQEFRSFH